jgi:hypothetical protein
LILNQYEREEAEIKITTRKDDKRPDSIKMDRTPMVKKIEKKFNPLKQGGTSTFSNVIGEDEVDNE